MRTPVSEMKKTKLRFGFLGRNQTPLFMIWREWWEGEEVVFARVLFKIP